MSDENFKYLQIKEVYEFLEGSGAYSEETAQPFQRNGMLFRFKRHKAC